jgi:HAD superfamily hydrolase (TIGR01450 family)
VLPAVGAVDGLVCDLDGVVYRGDEPIAGAADAINRMRAGGVRVVFCTNNSYPTVEDHRLKLARLGIDVHPSELLTSAVVTGETLAARGLGGRSALAIGGRGLREALLRAGLELNDSAVRADVVVVGYDPEFTYEAMRRASLAVRAGAEFVATNEDPALPAPAGALWPGAGAIVASIAVASGRRPEVMGKPHAAMMDAMEKRLGGARRVVIVGDRPETDLAGGAAKGWTTILVLSGVTASAGARLARPAPDHVVDSLAALAPKVRRD